MHRFEAWIIAKELVDPIIEQHGLEDQRATSQPMFVAAAMTTKVQQHIDHVLDVANWLSEEENFDTKI